MVENKLGQSVSDEEFIEGFNLAFNHAMEERRSEHGFKFN